MYYVIDGFFLTQRITGIQRYGYEICLELDRLVQKGEVEILVPQDAQNIPEFVNLKVVRYGKLKGILWEQFDFVFYLLKNKKQGLYFTNVVPLLYAKGIVTLHDVSYKANPCFFMSARAKLSAAWHCINYWCIAHSDMKIVTVSNFSKQEIQKYYHVKENRITVVYNAWQHMNRITATHNLFEKYSEVQKENYYFAMSTLAANKNFDWILNAAKYNPNEIFVIAGSGELKSVAALKGMGEKKNIIFLGYISDGDAKSLMANCKGFLFPTLYEGFGIPPIEAMACGANRVLVSDTLCMREVYGEAVSYINLQDDCFALKEGNKHEDEVRIILKRYSWEKSAKILVELL